MTTKPDQSEVVLHATGGTTFAGKDAVDLYRAITLKVSLKLYAKTGIKPTRGVTGPMMLAMAKQYAGKTYKRGQYEVAAADIEVWVDTMKAALPITDNRSMFQVDDNEPITYSELVRVNSDDEALCDWARGAKVGDVFPAHVNCTRIA